MSTAPALSSSASSATPPANRAALAVLFASMVIVMLGFGIAIPLMPFYIIHFNASGTALGLMIALYSFMQFLFAPVWGRFSDRVGRKPVLLLGVAGFAGAFLLQGLAQSLFWFIAARTLAGILSSATLPTTMAYVADTTTAENRARGVGMMGAAMGLGMIFGPLLGGLLAHINPALPAGLTALLQVTTDPATGETINLSIPFFVSGLLALAALPLIAFLLPESLPAHRRTAPVAPAGNRMTLLWAGLRGASGFLYALAFLLAFALANMEAVLALYGAARFGIGPAQVGLIMGGMGVLAVIQQGAVIGPLTRRVGEPRIIQGGLAIGIVGFVGLALAPTVWLFAAAALLFTAGNVLLQPSVTALISRRTAEGQGAAMGLNNSFQALGRGLGPLWAGFAFDLSSTLSFWTGALVQAIALYYAMRRLPATQATEGAAPG